MNTFKLEYARFHSVHVDDKYYIFNVSSKYLLISFIWWNDKSIYPNVLDIWINSFIYLKNCLNFTGFVSKFSSIVAYFRKSHAYIWKEIDFLLARHGKLHSEKLGPQFPKSSFKTFCKIAFYAIKSDWIRSGLYGVASTGKKTTCSLGQSWKRIHFVGKKSWALELSHTILTIFSSLVSTQIHSLKLPIQVGQPIKGDSMLF